MVLGLSAIQWRSFAKYSGTNISRPKVGVARAGVVCGEAGGAGAGDQRGRRRQYAGVRERDWSPL